MSKIPLEAIELLPCPFCGGKPNVYGAFDMGYKIICTHSFGQANVSGNTEEEAIYAWNNRRADAARAQGAEVEPVAWTFEWKPRSNNNPWETGVSIKDPRINPVMEIRNVQPLYTTPPAPEKMLEDAAKLIEAYAIQDTEAGKRLIPRQEGNLEGLYYVNAIRALAGKTPQPTDREKVLEDALQPFAKLAKVYDPDEGDDEDKCWVHEYTPTLGDLRRARAALAGGEA